ncbi:unnamed protein product [Sphagnum troendelagicum]
MKRESNQAHWKTQRGAIATAFLSQRPPDDDTRCCSSSSSSSSCSQRNRSGNPPPPAMQKQQRQSLIRLPSDRGEKELLGTYHAALFFLASSSQRSERPPLARLARRVLPPTRLLEPVCAYERDYDLLAITGHPYVQNWDLPIE